VRPPRLRTASACDRLGRGPLIVEQLADHWGIEPRAVGKTAFAELEVQGNRDGGLDQGTG
jgi:hypothetical protein